MSREIVRQWVSPVACLRPALDPREQPLDARAVERDLEAGAVDDPAARLAAAVGVQHRHQVVGAGQDEDIRFVAMAVPRQPLVGLAPDLGQAEAPAETERPISRARVIGERKRWGEAGTPGAERYAHRRCAGPGRRVDRELLVKASDGSAPLRDRDRREQIYSTRQLRLWDAVTGWPRLGFRGRRVGDLGIAPSQLRFHFHPPELV